MTSLYHPGFFLSAFVAFTITMTITVGDALAAPSRIALVIGNSAYQEGALKNPASDAALMARTLRDVGFEVLEEIDADERAMGRAMVRFSRKVKEAGPDTISLFYYAGHGLQYQGENYLVPIGARIEDEVDIDLEAVRASTMLSQLERAGGKLNIVILDACRNNPFKATTRSVDRGLAKMDAPNGTLLAYSTAPGRVASDGTGANSPYTQALSRAIKEPGIPIEQVFKRVRIQVMERTGEKQVPWESSSLTGEFNFVEAAPQVASLNPAPQTVEIEYWKSISQVDDPALFEAYLAQYPDGLFASIAKQRIAALSAPSAASGDLVFFQSIQMSDDIAQFEAYLQQYPDGQFATLARGRIAQLQKEQAEQAITLERQEERELWNGIRGASDLAAYEAFLARYPDGIYADVARARIASLSAAPQSALPSSQPDNSAADALFWDSIKFSSRKSDYQAYLNQFPNGTFAAIARNRAENGYAPQTAALTDQAEPYDGTYRLYLEVISSSGGAYATQLNSPGEKFDDEITVVGGKFSDSIQTTAFSGVNIDIDVETDGTFKLTYGWRGAYARSNYITGSLASGEHSQKKVGNGRLLLWKLVRQ